MSYLKGALGMIGGGMGAMALLNEEKGETFTSYPEPSRLKQFNEWNKRSREKQAVTMDYIHKHQDIMNPAIEEFGDGDIGYSIGALRVAASNNIIKPDMSVKEVAEIMKRENLEPYGFKLDESILNEVFNPFTKDLPQGDTMNPEDFR